MVLEVTMWARVTHVAVWMVVATVMCGLAWGSSGCNNKAACPSCVQTPNCMWCGRSGNFIGEDGKSLQRCIQLTDNVPSEWRDACGAGNVHEAVYFSEDTRSEECSFHGTYQCGECLCDPGYLGKHCECSSNALDDSNCHMNSTSPICSGRGTCTCGQCSCNLRDNLNEIIDGAFCECTNFLCNRFLGLVCGGPKHGECVCNKCVCKPGWTGDNCMCEDSNNNCINPENGELCSNQGDCECNQCRCRESMDGRYSGKYCEDCPTCKGKCLPFKPCVQCQVFQSGEFTPEECEANCKKFNASIVSVLVEEEGERLCTFFDEDDCRFTFSYGYNEDRDPVVRVQSTRDCPPRNRNSWQTLYGSYQNNTAAERSHGSIGVLVTLMLVIPLTG